MKLSELADRVDEAEAKTLDAVADMIDGIARRSAGEGAIFEKFEDCTGAALLAIGRRVLGRSLQRIEDTFADADAVVVRGETYVRHEPGTIRYHSLCGALTIKRWTYRLAGVRNGPTIAPLELAAGLIERGTPALAKVVALSYAKYDLRGVAEDLEAAQRLCPSRATMERMAREMASAAHAEVTVIERAVRLQERLPEGACGVVLGLDRGSVPMAEEREPNQAPATPRRERTEPYERAKPAPIDVNWRMAPVATVSITDAAGDSLLTRKYAATAAAGWDGIVQRAMADLAAAMKECPSLRVAVVQDGAHELWSTARAALATVPAVTAYCEAVDRYHVTERLGKVLQVLEKEPTVRAQRLARWNALLDTSAEAANEIERELCQAGPRRDADGQDALAEHRVYFANNKDRMRYVELRAAGLPVGSGATESGCNTMLNLRVKRNAEHWSVEGLEGVLTLRGLHESQRFDLFWKYFARRYRRDVDMIAAAA